MPLYISILISSGLHIRYRFECSEKLRKISLLIFDRNIPSDLIRFKMYIKLLKISDDQGLSRLGLIRCHAILYTSWTYYSYINC